jgi:short-subunit dehydrogenase
MPSSSSSTKSRYGGWALVTGGSSGIGLGFADALAKDGFDLVLVARSEDKLREAATELAARHGAKTRVVVQDLAAAGAAQRVFEAVRDLDVGVLVNNAGTGWIGRFDRQPLDNHTRLVALHCTAPVELTALMLPRLQARARSAVVLVASAGGYVPLPYYAVYSGTKAFLATWGEALAAELEGGSVDLLVVAPGDVKTNFQAVAGEMSTRWMSVEAVVSESLAALGRKTVVVPGWGDRLSVLLTRFLPRRTLIRIVANRQRAQTPADRR